MANLTKAKVVSVSSLSKAIDEAVAIASKRQSLKFDKDTMAIDWATIGRQLQEVKDFNVAMAAATDIAKSVKMPGIKPQPVVSKLGKGIFVGFWDRGQLPRQLG